MKNVQVIDGAVNSIFEIYQISEEQFGAIFVQGTDIAFAEDVDRRIDAESQVSFWDKFYSNRVSKEKVEGIHGTLHLLGSNCQGRYFPTRCETDVLRSAEILYSK